VYVCSWRRAAAAASCSSLTPVQQGDAARSPSVVGSDEQVSLSPVDDDAAAATTSQLELFQISALADSYEADGDPTASSLSVDDDESIAVADGSGVDRSPRRLGNGDSMPFIATNVGNGSRAVKLCLCSFLPIV